jgi:hypothetical protein
VETDVYIQSGRGNRRDDASKRRGQAQVGRATSTVPVEGLPGAADPVTAPECGQDQPVTGGTPSTQGLEDAVADAVSAETNALEVQDGIQHERLLRSGVNPSEAARLRWAKHRERQADETAAAVEEVEGKVVLVRTPARVGRIIARLARDAEKGSTQAARELRAYLEMYPVEDETDLSALDARIQAQILTRVLAEIIEDEGQLPDGPLD